MKLKENIIAISLLLLMGMLFLSFPAIGAGGTATAPIVIESALATAGNPDPGTPYTAGNGTNFQLKANGTYQIRNQYNFRLNLTCDCDCEMNMTQYQYYGEAPQGVRTMNRYMKIETNQTQAQVNATLAWKIGDDELEGMNRTTLRFAFHNGSTNMWQHVEQNWQEGDTVFCNTNHFSMWTITGELADAPGGNPTPGSPFQTSNGTSFQLQAGERYQLRTQSGFQLNMSANAQVNMSITECSSNPVGNLSQNQKQLGYFWNFSLEGTAGIQATFEWTFQNSDIAGLNRSTLRFAYYDENSNSWKDAEKCWIEGNTLYGNTTHFSTWTVIAEEESEPTTADTPGFTWLIGLLALAVALVPVKKMRRK
ncbi:MAG: hypothetical protein ACFFD4_18630 [Candidatus Odinarchaeota archaeon]